MSGRTGVRKDPSSFTQRALMPPCKPRTKLAVAVAGYGDYKQPPQTKGFERLSHQAWIEVLEVGVRTLGVQEWAEDAHDERCGLHLHVSAQLLVRQLSSMSGLAA